VRNPIFSPSHQFALYRDPGKYTKMPHPKALKFRDFYPNRFGNIFIRNWHHAFAKPNFYPNSGLGLLNLFFFLSNFFGICRAMGLLYVY
jgi:hypothetical protein